MMRIHAYYPVDVVNGPGTRCTLFVAGCEHQCCGCYNQRTWRLDSGVPFTLAMEEQLLADLNDTRVPRQGLSLSGGDPLHPHNVPHIRRLVKRVRQACPDKDIWLWTGYEMATLTSAQRAVVAELDVLIDGRFIEAEKTSTLPWRGSRNQTLWWIRPPRPAPR
ncbi:anaerobic ribonucleoside-triphosphate reductase-activating protein [Pantoea sp. Mb-10]|uniref:anaerobic ribonucleoside-triphosphate reductase-activating protein n=1 Tax=unclassified Pantoea TaxID=2630326 RepID=UPI001E3A611C|nr:MULTISPECIES: anaerobic ribonucleoside-triphosphate reductase-activating protein [unclassified Pantoea]MCE0490417.1 anaerobic ribonucleoside-triphosphate reductase-activating protein [Pantoea sp. Mb-10]MCE0501548.1 anaerobic ribonucleoside-triphosphate reductase-activating protein [Pantoea sp. Pb-8]